MYKHTYICIKFNHMNKPQLLCDGDIYIHLSMDENIYKGMNG